MLCPIKIYRRLTLSWLLPLLQNEAKHMRFAKTTKCNLAYMEGFVLRHICFLLNTISVICCKVGKIEESILQVSVQ